MAGSGSANSYVQQRILKKPARADKGSCRIEWTREQVVAHTGRSGPGNFKTFTLKTYGNYEVAMREALEWLDTVERCR